MTAFDQTADIVVVGFGCAGLAAAITAARRNAEVLVLEKQTEDAHTPSTRMSGGMMMARAEVAAATEGRVDILICDAGANGSAAPDVLSSDLIEKLIAIDLRGALPEVTAGGSIITIGSTCARAGTPGVHLAYHATKGAAAAFTRTAAEFGPRGMRVNSAHPGVMPPIRDRLIERISLRRTGAWDDLARMALFLVPDAAAYVSGADIPVDGGFLAT